MTPSLAAEGDGLLLENSKSKVGGWCRRLPFTFTNPGTDTQTLIAHVPPAPTLALGERDPSDGPPQPAAVNSLEMETLLT